MGTMLRRVAVGCVLILCGGMVPGCGGSLQQATRQEAKQFLGDGHPKILRIETVRDVGGNRLVVATVEGHFKPLMGASCGLGPCRPSPPISYAWLSFSQPKDMSGFGTTSASQIAAINNARSAKPIFGIFPDFTNPAIAARSLAATPPERLPVPVSRSSTQAQSTRTRTSSRSSSGSGGHSSQPATDIGRTTRSLADGSSPSIEANTCNRSE
jgi:hypothetical protein